MLPFYSKMPYICERSKEMSWDEIFEELEEELGREPDSSEVQNRILEIVSEVVCNSQEGAKDD